jgi:hypothetical protein
MGLNASHPGTTLIPEDWTFFPNVIGPCAERPGNDPHSVFGNLLLFMPSGGSVFLTA